MTLVRWQPFSDVPAFHDDVNQLFDELWRRSRGGEARAWYPAVDLLEAENEFKLVAELPGMTKDSVKITLNDNVVTLRGEKKSESESQKGSWHHVERVFGSFERSFQLTAPVDRAGVKARFDNGVLTVTLPKSEESRPREISID